MAAPANPTTTFSYDANWMPAWEKRPPSEHLTTNAPAGNSTEAPDPGYRTTTLPEGFAPTGPAAGVVPMWMLAQENGASAGIAGGGNGGGFVAGGLGMVTVLLLVYNLFSGVGLGFMLWKGIMDWKGNLSADFLATSRSTHGATHSSITIGVRDDNGREWFVPLAWIETAVQRVTTDNDDSIDAAIAAATVELTNTDGHTGFLRLQTLVDAAVYALRVRAAGLD